MVLSRSRLRLPAAFVTGLLLLMGAGEILGACYCAHRGGAPMAAHGTLPGQPAHDQTFPVDHDGHGAPHHALHAGESSTAPAGHSTDAHTEVMCQALWALACSVNPNPTPGGTEQRNTLLSPVHDSPLRPVELTDMVPLTARPHVLPLSQAPPTKT